MEIVRFDCLLCYALHFIDMLPAEHRVYLPFFLLSTHRPLMDELLVTGEIYNTIDDRHYKLT